MGGNIGGEAAVVMTFARIWRVMEVSNPSGGCHFLFYILRLLCAPSMQEKDVRHSASFGFVDSGVQRCKAHGLDNSLL